MPDDYYVSQYSGEEIDERLTAAHNAVRYDAAQSLTDAQKTQARANIAAAPNGFGLGEAPKYIADANDAVKNGWYDIGENTLNLPEPNTSVWAYAYLRVDVGNRPDAYIKQTITSPYQAFWQCEATRSFQILRGGWQPWEWVNPPMQLGVEYRTTERFLGKPVYTKLVDCGAGPNATRKSVDAGISNVDKAVSANGSWGVVSIPYEWFSGDSSGAQAITITLNGSNIDIASTINYSARTIYALIKYTKTTD